MGMKPQEIESKEADLTSKYNRKVTIKRFLLPNGEEAFLSLKNPQFYEKMMAYDQFAQSQMAAATYLFNASAIKEESDERFWSEKEEHEELRMGALVHCLDLVSYAIPEVKKK